MSPEQFAHHLSTLIGSIEGPEQAFVLGQLSTMFVQTKKALDEAYTMLAPVMSYRELAAWTHENYSTIQKRLTR